MKNKDYLYELRTALASIRSSYDPSSDLVNLFELYAEIKSECTASEIQEAKETISFWAKEVLDMED